MKQSHSVKNLKSSSAPKPLKRQSSSPYLTRRPDEILLDKTSSRNSSSVGTKQRYNSNRFSNSLSYQKLTGKSQVLPQSILPKKSLASRK